MPPGPHAFLRSTPQPLNKAYPWAQLLPGGREFLYTLDDPKLGSQRARIATIRGDRQDVEVVHADSRVQYTDSLRSDTGYLVYLRSGALLAQPFDLAARRIAAEPKAIARHVPSFGPTGAADFSVSQRGVLAYQSFVSRSQFIWVDRKGKRLSAASPPNTSATHVRLSPNGRWLATVPFNIERGMPEIWMYDAASGAGRKVVFGTDIPGTPVWSPDSRRLVYLSGRCWPRLALSSFDGSPETEALPDTRRNGKELFYLGADGRVYAVAITFASGHVRAAQPEPLFTIDAEARAAIHSVVSFDVSPDGNRFVIPSMTPGESSAIVVLQDWESLVPK